MQPLNPYQSAESIPDAELVPYFSGPIDWEGHRFLLLAEQLPISLWLVACVMVEIDGTNAKRFIKWRWNKRADLTFMHDGRSCLARLHFSGANQIHCRLAIDGVAVGESLIPAKNFFLGLTTVAITTVGIAAIVFSFK